jgi:hypothetical protein
MAQTPSPLITVADRLMVGFETDTFRSSLLTLWKTQALQRAVATQNGHRPDRIASTGKPTSGLWAVSRVKLPPGPLKDKPGERLTESSATVKSKIFQASKVVGMRAVSITALKGSKPLTRCILGFEKPPSSLTTSPLASSTSLNAKCSSETRMIAGKPINSLSTLLRLYRRLNGN